MSFNNPNNLQRLLKGSSHHHSRGEEEETDIITLYYEPFAVLQYLSCDVATRTAHDIPNKCHKSLAVGITVQIPGSFPPLGAPGELDGKNMFANTYLTNRNRD